MMLGFEPDIISGPYKKASMHFVLGQSVAGHHAKHTYKLFRSSASQSSILQLPYRVVLFLLFPEGYLVANANAY